MAAPWDYPGTATPHSGLLLSGTFLPLHGDDGSQSLDDTLARAGVAPVAARTLVVAVGSNASPSVMRRKAAAGDASEVIPFFSGTLHGMAVGHSAHASLAGYVATAPYLSPHAATTVVASLLDDQQLGCVDTSEFNYVRRLIRCDQCRLEVDGPEQPVGFHIYDSRWGVVSRPGGEPLPAGSQGDLFATLRAEWPPYTDILGGQNDLRTTLRLLAADEQRRVAFREALAASGWVRTSGLGRNTRVGTIEQRF